MRRLFKIGIMGLLTIFVVLFQDCDHSQFSKINNTSTIGNPMAPLSLAILDNVCSVINRCHQVNMDACHTGVLNTSGFDTPLGLPSNYSQLSTILQAETSGSLVGNTLAGSACTTNIQDLDCSSPDVQGAYDPTQSNPYIGTPQMLSPTACQQSFTPGVNLEIPVELVDTGLSSTTALQTFARSRTSLNTADYDGAVTYSFEVVAENTGASAATVSLVNGAGGSVASISIPAGTNPTRLRGAMNATGADSYRVSLGGTSSAGQVKVHAARILVKQVGATKTKIYIPLTANWTEGSEATSSDNASATSAITSDPYYDQPNADAFSLWLKNKAAFSQIAPGTPWTLEVVMSTSGGSTAFASLFNNSSGAQVVASELSTGATTPTLLSTDFSDTATGFTDSHQFMVQIKNTSGATALYRAGLWLKLTNLAHAEVYYRVYRMHWQNKTDPLTTIVESRVFMDKTVFMNPTIYHEVTGSGNSSSIMCTEALFDVGLSDVVTAGSSLAGGDLTFTGTVATLLRSGPLSVTSGHRFISTLVANSGTTACYPRNAFVVVTF